MTNYLFSVKKKKLADLPVPSPNFTIASWFSKGANALKFVIYNNLLDKEVITEAWLAANVF